MEQKMKLKNVATNAADEIKNTLSATLSDEELSKVTGIIAEAMEKAVHKVSNRSIEFCNVHLNPNTDIAHQIQKDIKRKQETIITNLSSLR